MGSEIYSFLKLNFASIKSMSSVFRPVQVRPAYYNASMGLMYASLDHTHDLSGSHV